MENAAELRKEHRLGQELHKTQQGRRDHALQELILERADRVGVIHGNMVALVQKK
jgi:hypothetical protein